MKRLTTKKVIDRFIEEHVNKYDYSLVEYVNKKTKVKIICPEHGVFEQLPPVHNSGCGCQKCGNILTGKKQTLTTEVFVKKAKDIHGNVYDYSLVDYENAKTKIKIICSKHGEFNQLPSNHLSGCGCLKCRFEKNTQTQKEFIYRANNVHNNLYEYDSVIYKNSKIKVKIFCNEHGYFEQSPECHLRPQGCPFCKKSKGELLIKNILDNYKIKYISQKKFDECKNIKCLPFDFYIENQNVCLEFDGEQHFKAKSFGEKDKNLILESFLKIKNNDRIKNDFCKENEIKLIRITYKQIKDIEDILYKNGILNGKK